MPTHLDPAVLDLLRRQHGLITRGQALEAGLSEHEIRYLVRSRRLERIGHCLYGARGHRASWRRDLWAAWLHAGSGSVISHHSAGRLRGFPECETGRRQLIVPDKRRHPPDGVQWFRITDLHEADADLVDGLPVTTPTRTVVDLAGDIRLARLRLLVERGVIERQFTIEGLGATLGRVRRKGKPGVRALSVVLDDLGPGERVPRSELERLLDHVIEVSRLPAPAHEHPLPGVGPIEGFVDRCWPEACLIVEADGRRWHERRQQMVRDHDRDLQAQVAGYETTRLMWEQLRHDPRGTARQLGAIYERRVQLLGGAHRGF